MTVSVGLPVLRYLMWLPFWPTFTKPCLTRIDIMCFEEYSLGMLQAEGAKFGGLGSLYGGNIGIFEIKVKRFMQIADSFVFGLAETRHIDI
jgi:hypothetical protein